MAGDKNGSVTETKTWTRDELPPALREALDLAVDKQARAPVILRLTDVAGYTDWALIVSGRSDRHVASLADAISAGLRKSGTRPLAVDGLGDHAWDLLDYDDFMVHVFYHPIRMHYDLESMWSDAPRVELDLPEDVMDTSDLDALEVPSVLPSYRGDAAFGGFEDEFAEGGDEDAWADDDWDDDGEWADDDGTG